MTQPETSGDINFPETKPLRPGVVPVLFNFHSLRLFVGRIHDPQGKIGQHWSTVEGGIEMKTGETVYEAARREIEEEVGLTKPDFLAACTEPMAYSFEGHPRYGGKSLAVLFYGFTPSRRRYIDLDPRISPEDMAFTAGTFVGPEWARKLIKIGADPEREAFCDQLADRIAEIHLAMQISVKTFTSDGARLMGSRELGLAHEECDYATRCGLYRI